MAQNDSLFMTVDAGRFGAELLELLCKVTRDKGRVEITNCDGKTCVMISKEELDSLEQALEILSSTDAGKAMHESVEHFALIIEGMRPQV